ncbi:E1-like protein-activating enzyme Gsa7p/Apg7p, variant 1 [Aphanomyces astaci]|uniref:E1-like protein-activating enzyme Gsa7p/Apg7p, variant 1 n=1 Tax=Aphanomyces astaci TaxID=112090 RepID=W4GQM6_APHAT|nr:E1-like protein-activating enzyme Gsa7p/Apg7p, variant 1 [Aphanomyces astaci]ETV82035.1 E1-like protein-activating enzyme Gsa7p/Apg7p, variant 1 [Aphanomyces astaci]|eukprot:XP_009828772.1 E1-like protein-activating enzyme Gsa7p/Apg7p, variant 1 [Aphanomyces astaci]
MTLGKGFTMPTTLLQFQSFTSSPNVSFFQKLAQLKLDTYQLSDATQDITGFFELNSHATVPPRFLVDDTSFDFDASSSPNRSKHEWRVPGVLVNTNTLEDFKNLDKVRLLNDAKARLRHAIDGFNPLGLQTFVLCTFADLKTHTYWYRFAFPAVVPSAGAYQLQTWTPANSFLSLPHQQSIVRQLVNRRHVHDEVTSANFPAAFIFDLTSSTVHDLEDLRSLSPPSALVFGFVDPSGLPTNPGWPLRNFLIWISQHCPTLTSAVILAYRDPVHHISNPPEAHDDPSASFGLRASYIATIELTPYNEFTSKVVGWELNVQGKSGPRQLQLANLLDPLQLAKTSVDLNLKLMRWRQLPHLDLDKLAHTKCLLLGAGTLGCHFARNLVAWGFRSLTLVDYGKISHSNPVRQPLYEFGDVGEWKAPTAAKALKRIYPLVECEGHVLSIPMAGHALSNPQALEETKSAYQELERMIISQDVIFLGTDTRESRWLPTVLAAAHQKLVINAALGFDTYLVMRHGVPDVVDLGCYFCNDIVSPTDSLTDRTLDQMCTVTRPGGAAIAGNFVHLPINLAFCADLPN